MHFKVKKNPILVFLVIFLIPTIFLPPIGSYIEKEGMLISLFVFIFISPVIIILVWALLNSYFKMNETEFLAVFGIIKMKIPYHDIQKVSFSFNPISSPAWTFRRLKIEYKRFDFVLLSLPKDENLFLNELHKKCPNAEIFNSKGIKFEAINQ